MRLGAAPHRSSDSIRVLIVENHQLVSDSLELLLDDQIGIEVVGKVGSVAEASELRLDIAPDVVITDFHLGDGTGRDAAVAVKATYPNARFVFLSRDGSDDAQLAAVEAGASAHILKSAPASELISALRTVAAGQNMITPSMVSRLIVSGRDLEAIRESLSPRELEVLQLISEGVGTHEIAHRLGISYSTVRSHARAINRKLSAHSMVTAVVTARGLELVN